MPVGDKLSSPTTKSAAAVLPPVPAPAPKAAPAAAAPVAPAAPAATAPAANPDRAAFDKALEKNGVSAGKLVRPEEIWRKAPEKPAAEPAKKAVEEPEGPVRDASGRFAPKAEEPAATQNDDGPDDVDLERARHALVRSGFKKRELDAMSREEVLKRGLKRAAALDADDEAHRFVKSRSDGAKPTAGENGQGKDDAPARPTPKQLELDPILKPLAENLGLDEGGVSALKTALSEVARVAAENAVSSVAATTQETEAQRQLQTALGAAQAEVGKLYPDLLDPDTFSEVLEEVDVIGRSALYQRIANPQERINRVIRDACQRMGLENAALSDSQVRPADLARDQRRHARSSVSERTQPPATTRREFEFERFQEAALKHGL